MSESTLSSRPYRIDFPDHVHPSRAIPIAGRNASSFTAITGLVACMISALCMLLVPSVSLAKERRGEVTVNVILNAPADAKRVELWIPYPMSDENQEVTGVSIRGNYSSVGVYRERKFGNNILHAEWNSPGSERTLTYTFRVERKEVVTKDFPGNEASNPGREFERYLDSTRLGRTGGTAKMYAGRIAGDKKTTLAKASAIYDWIVENMYRDPAVKGCGLGEVDALLLKLGGKCADIHSVFVALARAEGIPAREVFGIRMPGGKEGNITKSQHCWAEFHLPGYGWVVVDPADVRKAILERKITPEEARPLREYYFGAVDENRVAFGTGRDVVLNPPQRGEPLNYFMYPYAESDGKPLNEDLYGFNLGYTIAFREL